MTKELIIGGGCFWCTEAVFKRLQGVVSVQSGYCGGHVDNPTYRQVCEKNTGHIEVIRIEYDPKQISFEDLLEVYFATHDPTTLDRQGADVGPQYASAIFYANSEEEQKARAAIAKAQDDFNDPIVTKLLPAATFWPAEDYHNNYFDLNPNQPYCAVVIGEKVHKFMRKYADKLKA